MKDIVIKNAKENNLKGINLTIPREKLVVFTGLSGSGKSSLAFDTIFAEGQRRYVESLSAYARQFLGQMNKPKNNKQQPTLYRWHRYGNLRLLAFVVRKDRHRLLPKLQCGNCTCVGRPNCAKGNGVSTR